MAMNNIVLTGLPFQPEFNQVFYIENEYDLRINNILRRNYYDLKSKFADIGLDFIYLPYMMNKQQIEAKVRYYAPYLSSEFIATEVKSDVLAQYISDDEVRKNLKPSLIFGGEHDTHSQETAFLQIALEDYNITNSEIFDEILHVINSYQGVCCAKYSYENDMPLFCKNNIMAQNISHNEESVHCRRSARPKSQIFRNLKEHLNCLFNCDQNIEKFDCDSEISANSEQVEEDNSLINTSKVLKELQIAVQKLRLEGVSLMAIHEFIDRQEPLSRMVITPDYRIFLPDYNEMEIEMGALPKAIYFLFLRYPNGIIYKHMQDYYKELLNIYKQLRPNTDEARLNLTITKVVNPFGNALNENLARIRKAFVEKFDEHLANNYIITGERGSQYLIPLDRELITWEE